MKIGRGNQNHVECCTHINVRVNGFLRSVFNVYVWYVFICWPIYDRVLLRAHVDPTSAHTVSPIL